MWLVSVSAGDYSLFNTDSRTEDVCAVLTALKLNIIKQITEDVFKLYVEPKIQQIVVS